MKETVAILMGLLFFVVFFSLSMLTMCYSADESSLKSRLYKRFFANEHFDRFLRRFNAHQSVSYAVFVFGIVFASFFVLRSLVTQEVRIKTSALRSFVVPPIALTALEKAFLASFYIVQDGTYLILLLKRPETTVESQSDFVLHKLPNRRHFCRICQKSTQKFDHHCAWVGRCVGAGNAFWFALFLCGTFYTNCGHFVVNVLIARQLAHLTLGYIFFNYTPFCAQTALFLVVAIFISPFALSHVRNILRNETTYERLRRQWLCKKIKAGEFFISKDLVGTAACEGGKEYLSAEQSIALVRARNVWNKGAVKNLLEALQMGLV